MCPPLLGHKPFPLKQLGGFSARPVVLSMLVFRFQVLVQYNIVRVWTLGEDCWLGRMHGKGAELHFGSLWLNVCGITHKVLCVWMFTSCRQQPFVSCLALCASYFPQIVGEIGHLRTVSLHAQLRHVCCGSAHKSVAHSLNFFWEKMKLLWSFTDFLSFGFFMRRKPCVRCFFFNFSSGQED